MRLLIGLLLAPALFAQGWPVEDWGTHILTAKEIAKIAEEITVTRGIQHNTRATDLWLGQIFLSKLPWSTSLPKAPQNTKVHNTIGEMANWGTTLSTGLGGHLSWTLARSRLSSLASILLAKQPASRTVPVIGSDLVSQLATIEAIDGLGPNNLAIIGEARGYLTQNLPALQGLQKQILSPGKDDNGPTQQMQLIASANAQQSSLAVQHLAVATGQLETLTAIAKALGDAATSDLNLQERHAETVITQNPGQQGWAEEFRNR
jgi:hypothetical protein